MSSMEISNPGVAEAIAKWEDGVRALQAVGGIDFALGDTLLPMSYKSVHFDEKTGTFCVDMEIRPSHASEFYNAGTPVNGVLNPGYAGSASEPSLEER